MKINTTSKQPNTLVNTKRNTAELTLSASQLATTTLIQSSNDINVTQEQLSSFNLSNQVIENSQTLSDTLTKTSFAFSETQPNTPMILAVIITVGGIIIGGCGPREPIVPELCVTPFPDSSEWLKPWITPIPDPNLGCKPLITPFPDRSDWWKPWVTPIHTPIFGPRGLALPMMQGGKASAEKITRTAPKSLVQLPPRVAAPVRGNHVMPPHNNPVPVADTTTRSEQPARALPVENSAPKIADKQEYAWKDRKKTEDSYSEKLAKETLLSFGKGVGWATGVGLVGNELYDHEKAKELISRVGPATVEYAAEHPAKVTAIAEAGARAPAVQEGLTNHGKAMGEAAATKVATGTANWVTSFRKTNKLS